MWIFVIVDNEHLQEQANKIEMYYKSNQYKQLFDKFPVVVVLSDNIENSRQSIESNKREDLFYQYLKLNKVKSWEYNYI